MLGTVPSKLTWFPEDGLPPYAILSPTRIHIQGVPCDEAVGGTGKDKRGHHKIRFCGERAAVHGLESFWVDICCIDESTSEEVHAAIHSLFSWYERAARCYVYLPGVSVSDDGVERQTFSRTVDGRLWTKPVVHTRLDCARAPGTTEWGVLW